MRRASQTNASHADQDWDFARFPG